MGLGRPKAVAEKRRPTALRLPESLRERVAEEADRRGTSFNHMVIKALELYLDCLPPIDVPRPGRDLAAEPVDVGTR